MKRPLQNAQITRRRQRNRPDCEIPLAVQFGDGQRFLLSGFVKRIFHRRTAVPDAFPDLLRRVDMAERDIVKRRKHGGIDVVRSADMDGL